MSQPTPTPKPTSSSAVLPANLLSYAQSLLSNPAKQDSPIIQTTISKLNLQEHIEGGHYAETDRDPLIVPNPFQHLPALSNPTAIDDSPTRNASTTIYYLLSPRSPVGHFHRNRARTVHTLHRGRGVYVLLHMERRDPVSGRVPVETFVVGQDLERGERVQWIVEGGVFKASFLIPDADGDGSAGSGCAEGKGKGASSSAGLLISETVVPGFEFADHDFLTAETMRDVLEAEQVDELGWLLKRDEQRKLRQV